MKSSTSLSIVAVGLLLFALASIATAQTTFVSTRAGLNANDFMDWGTLSNPETVSYTTALSLTTNGGLGLTASSPNNTFRKNTEHMSWFGDFATGAKLLDVFQGPLTLTFANAVSAVGANIDAAFAGDWTGANITAYDAGGNVLGSFTQTDHATKNGDDTALFLGVKSTSANIAKITFDDVNANSFGPVDQFAINQLDINTNAPAPVVPEGSSDLMLLAGMAVPGAGYLLRRLRSRA